MKKLLYMLEPLIWGPFVTGTFLTPLVFPALILVVGIAGPLGMVPEGALSYERMHGLAQNPLVVIGMLVVIPLSLLNGAHHLRHVSIDMGNGEQDHIVALILYGIFQVGAVITALAILRIFIPNFL